MSFLIQNSLLRLLLQLVEKKQPGPEINIVFGNNFDKNLKIELDI